MFSQTGHIPYLRILALPTSDRHNNCLKRQKAPVFTAGAFVWYGYLKGGFVSLDNPHIPPYSGSRKVVIFMLKKPRIIYAVLFLALLITEVLIALFVNDYFIRPFFGDVLVTVLLCCFCRIFIPTKISALPLYVFLFATAVEISQYFDLVKLLGLENNRFLSVLMGRTFSWPDILCYGVGCGLFFLLDLVIRKHSKSA